jgi:hypothetical protein
MARLHNRQRQEEALEKGSVAAWKSVSVYRVGTRTLSYIQEYDEVGSDPVFWEIAAVFGMTGDSATANHHEKPEQPNQA